MEMTKDENGSSRSGSSGSGWRRSICLYPLAGGDPKETVIQAFENVYTEGQTDPMEELVWPVGVCEGRVSASQNSGADVKAGQLPLSLR